MNRPVRISQDLFTVGSRIDLPVDLFYWWGDTRMYVIEDIYYIKTSLEVSDQLNILARLRMVLRRHDSNKSTVLYGHAHLTDGVYARRGKDVYVVFTEVVQ